MFVEDDSPVRFAVAVPLEQGQHLNEQGMGAVEVDLMLDELDIPPQSLELLSDVSEVFEGGGLAVGFGGELALWLLV